MADEFDQGGFYYNNDQQQTGYDMGQDGNNFGQDP